MRSQPHGFEARSAIDHNTPKVSNRRRFDQSELTQSASQTAHLE